MNFTDQLLARNLPLPTATPAPPPGFVLDAPVAAVPAQPSAVPAPPPGFALDVPTSDPMQANPAGTALAAAPCPVPAGGSFRRPAGGGSG